MSRFRPSAVLFRIGIRTSEDHGGTFEALSVYCESLLEVLGPMGSFDIVLAEDDSGWRRMLALALRERGYRVRGAWNGRQAIAHIDKMKPDLLIVDLNMPVMDGVALLRQLRQSYRRKSLPVIVLSGHAERSIVAEAIRLGIDEYVLKVNLNMPAFMDKVESLIGSPYEEKASQAATRGNATRQSGEDRFWKLSTEVDWGSTQPLLNASTLNTHIDRFCSAKGFSPAINSLLKVLDDPDATPDDIADCATLEQALAARLMALANSMGLGGDVPVKSIRAAVVRLGTSKVREAAMTIGLTELSSRSGQDEAIHLGRFWEHSISAAIIGAETVRESPLLGDIDPEVAYTLGLIHDIGRLVLVETIGSIYRRVVEVSRQAGASLIEAEEYLLGTTHAAVGETVLKRWLFSAELRSPVASHHQSIDRILKLEGYDRSLTMVLYLANNLSRIFVTGDSGDPTIQSVERLMRELGLNRDFLDRLQMVISQRWSDLKAVVGSQSSQTWPDHLEILRNRFGSTVRAGFLCLDPDWADIDLMLRRLGCISDGEEVNLWIAIARTGQTAEVDQTLQDSERSLGVGPQPLILLTSDQMRDVRQEDTARKTLNLALPLNVDIFIQAVGAMLGKGASVKAAG